MLYCFPVTLLVYDDECYICLQHLQCVCPQEWLLSIVVLGLDISARTNRFLILFGCLKATMGGAGKMLYCLEFVRPMPNAHEWCWSCFLDSDGMWGHNGFFYISVFLCTEINCPWNCYELCLNFSSQYFFYSPFFQMIFKLTQSFFQRFVVGANSPESKSLTVWYALSHMRRMTPSRQKVLIGVGRFAV